MNNFNFLNNCDLFSGISKNDFEKMSECLLNSTKTYKQNEYIFTSDSTQKVIGVVLCGEVLLVSDDYWGNRTILSRVGENEIFGESFAFCDEDFFPISILTSKKSEILLLNAEKILSPCKNICPFHSRLIENTVRILANKNAGLVRKIKHITMRTTKQKLLSYLSFEAQKANSNSFSIPFTREQLANFLSVDRSAMSNELCKMRDSGILDFSKNQFILYEKTINVTDLL